MVSKTSLVGWLKKMIMLRSVHVAGATAEFCSEDGVVRGLRGTLSGWLNLLQGRI